MRRCGFLLLLALGLLLAESSGATRLFGNKQQLKRAVGKRKWLNGQLSRKEVDNDELGRVAFDPNYESLDDDSDPDDLGLDDDIHDVTPELAESRLRQLFPQIDTNHDGVISVEELQRHLYNNGLVLARRRAATEFAESDANHDGKLTAAEYLASMVEDDQAEQMAVVKAAIASNTMPDPIEYSSYVDSTRAAFIYADANHDGWLNHDEFFDFLNPEEGSNVLLKVHRLRQDIHDHLQLSFDAEGHMQPAPEPGQKLELDFEQFYAGFWSQFSVWDPTERDDDTWSEERERRSALARFTIFDTNADSLLTPEELLPAFADIHPTENRYSRMQAEHMMDMADCKDDLLTLDKMLAATHAFYGLTHHYHDHSEL